MSELFHPLFIVCPLVFLAGVVDAVAGGGGLISLPAYLVAGLPPHAATATNKCSSIFGAVVSAFRFLKEGRIHRQAAVSASLCALIGSALGSRLNLLLPETLLHYVLLALLPVIAVFLLTQRTFGAEAQPSPLSPRALVLLTGAIGLVIGCYDGFFGPGTGTFLILAFTAFCGFDLLAASGTAKLVNLSSNLAAFLTFAAAGQIVWSLGLPAVLFSIAGHYVGASLSLTKGAKIIRPMFFVVLALLLLRTLSDLLL